MAHAKQLHGGNQLPIIEEARAKDFSALFNINLIMRERTKYERSPQSINFVR